MRNAIALLGLLVCVIAAGCSRTEAAKGSPSPPPLDKPDLVLITVDALRPDHLGVYGYDRPTSPTIDRFAANATVFETAVAHASYTVPSVSSILTGKLPLFAGAKHQPTPLAQSNVTLAEVLSAAGYDTAAFVDNGLLNRNAGWDQGFGVHECVDEDEASYLTDRALEWLARPREKPLFLWIHYLDPHAPYKNRPEYFEYFKEPTDERSWIKSGEVDDASIKWDAKTARNAVNLYDGEIRYLDRHLALVLAALDARDRAGRTLIALSADHGEAFCEHGDKSHGYNVLDENVRVPLIVRPPAASALSPRARRLAPLIGLVDLYPTFADYAGVAPPAEIQGRSLRPLLEDRPGWGLRPVISQASSGDFGIRAQAEKIVNRHEGDDYVWYDLADDPGEFAPVRIDDLAPDRTATAAGLLATLRAYTRTWAERSEGAARQTDPDTVEALRKLGYVVDEPE